MRAGCDGYLRRLCWVPKSTNRIRCMSPKHMAEADEGRRRRVSAKALPSVGEHVPYPIRYARNAREPAEISACPARIPARK